MRINFELNTENENPSMLQATAAYLNNLANINAGTAIEPVHGFLEPGEVVEPSKGEKPVTEPQNDFKKESIAESIAAVKEQLAAEKEETEKEEPKKPARRRAKTAPEVKTEPEPEQPKEPEQIKEPEQDKEPEEKEPVKEPEEKEPVKEPEVKEPEPEQPKESVSYTIEQAKAVAMKALNKGRREVVKDAFGYVGASSFPTLAPENFADFIKYIEENL